jgi:hypothetical protein
VTTRDTCQWCSRATPAPLLHRWLAIDSSEFCIGGLYCSRHEVKVMLDVLISREEGRVAGLKEARTDVPGCCICPGSGRRIGERAEGDVQMMHDKFDRYPNAWVRGTCPDCGRLLWWESVPNAVVRWPSHSVPTPESAGH